MLFAPSSFPESPQLETKKALILLDFQEDFVSPTGRLYVDNISSFLPKLPSLVHRFRENGQVVWATTEYRGPRPALSPETGGYVILLQQFVKYIEGSGSSECQTPSADDGISCHTDDADLLVELDDEAFLAAEIPQRSSRCCLSSTSGSRLTQSLEAVVDRSKDIVVCKSEYSAFADMSLLFQLRTRMVTDLYLCGSLSNISVYATVLDAVRHGFSVTIIEDCLGYRNESCHVSAMKQMADNMCAEGIDHQELMDDLAGLLGDVIKEESFATRYQVDISHSVPQETKRHNFQNADYQPNSTHQSYSPKLEESNGNPSTDQLPLTSESYYCSNAPVPGATRNRSSTLDSSPPRKRSTNEIDDDLEDYHPTRLPPIASARRQSYEVYAKSGLREQKPKVRSRRKDGPETPRRPRPSPPQSSQSGEVVPVTPTSPTIERNTLHETKMEKESMQHVSKKMAKKLSQAVLGPGDHIGDGTSSVIYNVLSEDYAKKAFEKLKTNIKWQKMYHRSGEVPRLVAVQGDVDSSIGGNKTYPIYRHPSDESPELLPFDHTVDVLRRECENHVGHPLNHVLIQHYRNSEDNISEHSDKTLDIMRNSSIVNLSLGAQRTMTLRSKKVDAPQQLLDQSLLDTNSPNAASSPIGSVSSSRTTQRIPLPNASIFILTTSTNAKFLHAIRADKRPACEKSEAETAFNSERISLTFRYVATYITETADGKHTIWGQGAKGKTQDQARPVLQPSNIDVSKPIENEHTTPTPPTVATKSNEQKVETEPQNHHHQQNPIQESEATPPPPPPSQISPSITEPNPERGTPPATTEKESDKQASEMIIGFGRENHESDSFNWDAVYGSGFDVVNFVTKPIDHLHLL